MRRELVEAILDQKPVEGLTHNFYRYPARFSPKFAREIIRHFSQAGDLIYDPFVGGGTTLVEARSLGRRAVGTDVNSLAVFVSKVKTTKLAKKDIDELEEWTASATGEINLHRPSRRPYEWIEKGYQHNITSKNTWPIRKAIEQFLEQIEDLGSNRQRAFARCVLLSTAQWALDCRNLIPSTTEFRAAFVETMSEMLIGIEEYSQLARQTKLTERFGLDGVACFNCSLMKVEKLKIFQNHSPDLVVTSPPYPATHVLYHRWQVQGRRETKAPFWIADEQDGHFAPYYCMGERRRDGNTDYFQNIQDAFSALSNVLTDQTLVVQMVAFPDPSWQLPQYLESMRNAGFRELKKGSKFFKDGRLWRSVPNRKFYAGHNGYGTANEVVLFHRLA